MFAMNSKRHHLVFLAALLTVFSSIAWGARARACLVLETVGNNRLTVDGKQARMRTLQVLPSGATVEVPDAGKLRLSYFVSGRKETIEGPCALRIGEEESVKTGGRGRVTVISKRDASTDLDETENLRRSGGALQAKLTEYPAPVVAAVLQTGDDAPPVKARQGTTIGQVRGGGRPAATVTTTAHPPPVMTTRSYAPLRINDLSPVYLPRGTYPPVSWSGGTGDSAVTLLSTKKQLGSKVIQKESYKIPLPLLSSGENYTLRIRRGKQVLEKQFRLLSQAETEEYFELVNTIRRQEAADRRAELSRLLVLQLELGLLQDAHSTASKAVRAYPQDEGFQYFRRQIENELSP